MRESEMRQIAAWIDSALAHAGEKPTLTRVRDQVRELCKQFPAPA
jgi:glycine hydroxymethyltransferase